MENWHRHAIEQAARRWRGGHDSAVAETRLYNLIYALAVQIVILAVYVSADLDGRLELEQDGLRHEYLSGPNTQHPDLVVLERYLFAWACARTNLTPPRRCANGETTTDAIYVISNREGTARDRRRITYARRAR